jgi:hypothetical protein
MTKIQLHSKAGYFFLADETYAPLKKNLQTVSADGVGSTGGSTAFFSARLRFFSSFFFFFAKSLCRFSCL